MGIYNRFHANLMNKEVDLEADTIKVMLLDDNHAFDRTDNVLADVSANEISGVGYTAGGQELAGKAVTQNTITKWDANDAQWLNATFSAWHAVIYDDDLGSDDLICSIDFGGEQTVTDGTFQIIWDTDGIITLEEA